MPHLHDDDEPTAPYVRGSDTSREAAERIDGPAADMACRVLQALRDARGGLTCDEVELILGMRHQSASARIRALVLAGRVLDSGKRRNTRSGRAAAVWIATPPAGSQGSLF